MELFAMMVRYGSGPRLDPMLEEKRGWIGGEMQRHDVEMEDGVIEVMAEASKQIGAGGEHIPSFWELIRTQHWVFSV